MWSATGQNRKRIEAIRDAGGVAVLAHSSDGGVLSIFLWSPPEGFRIVGHGGLSSHHSAARPCSSWSLQGESGSILRGSDYGEEPWKWESMYRWPSLGKARWSL